ncbi:MAG: endonuclease/exonuclease/phosphatase family protein [Polyangiales bacterium]
MRIATYNIHRAVGADGRQDPARVARVLREIDADLVALQEVAYRTSQCGDLLEYLAQNLSAHVIEGATMKDERGHYGNAVVTRWPVTTVDRLDISVPHREPRGAIEMAFQVGGVGLQVMATHLGLRPRERRLQIQTLLPRFEGTDADVRILLGDLNEWFLWGRPLRWLRRIFGDAPAPATFPARCPRFALDRVWVDPQVVATDIRVHASATARAASDHLPVVGELNLMAAPASSAGGVRSPAV